MSLLRFFLPATDSVVLLYSDTCSGAFCAGVLYRLLTQVYNLPQGTIACQKIDELRERPRAGMEQVAENNTRRALLEGRKEGVQNIFVMTGGFKSTLPILTIIALVHNDHIYYLFRAVGETAAC